MPDFGDGGENAPSPEDGDRFGHYREIRGRFHRT